MNTNFFLRFTIIALLINNCIGIILNFMLTMAATLFGLGIPGIIFLCVLLYWTFYKHYRKPMHFINWAILMIPYNVLIYYFAKEFNLDYDLETFPSIGGFPSIFPLLNCILFVLLVVICTIEIYIQRKAHKEDKALF